MSKSDGSVAQLFTGLGYYASMQKLGAGITYCIAELAGDSEQARINLRANQVRTRYRRAIEAVYRKAAPMHLAHTNNVYIMEKGGVRTLIVYVDESIFAAELNAQRELIKLHLLQEFGEDVEQFEIHVSRGKYKGNHPYAADLDGGQANSPSAKPLSAAEREYVQTTATTIQDNHMREAFQKAMTADLEWKKGEIRATC